VLPSRATTSYNAFMRSRGVVAALLLVLGGAGSASGQTLSLEFHDGRVKLTAENVPVTRILAEWTRLGGTQIVHGERIPGAPVTLQLVDAPERQALDILLRNAAGYMVLARDPNSKAGASSFEKIMVLATTTRAPAAAALPQPPPQAAPQFREPEPIEAEEDEPPVGPARNFPRGRANLPPAAAQIPEDDDEEVAPEEDDPSPPPPGNPFGVVPGVVRPGTITAPPKNAPEAEPLPR
jgi:hypothetical protein